MRYDYDRTAAKKPRVPSAEKMAGMAESLVETMDMVGTAIGQGEFKRALSDLKAGSRDLDALMKQLEVAVKNPKAYEDTEFDSSSWEPIAPNG
jgi:U3 small nucleolar RNA-associated protein 14